MAQIFLLVYKKYFDQLNRTLVIAIKYYVLNKQKFAKAVQKFWLGADRAPIEKKVAPIG